MAGLYFHLIFCGDPSLKNCDSVKKKKEFVVTCTPSISTRLEQKAVDLSRHQSLNGVARQFGVGVIIEKAIYAIAQACQHRCFSSFPRQFFGVVVRALFEQRLPRIGVNKTFESKPTSPPCRPARPGPPAELISNAS